MTGLQLGFTRRCAVPPSRPTALGTHSRAHRTALAATLADAPASQAALVPQQSTSKLQADAVPASRSQHAIVAKASLPLQLDAVPAPEAATILFPTRFPTITSARKACRRKWLMVQEKLATACTVVQPGDCMSILERVRSAQLMVPCSTAVSTHSAVQVVYEDDHLACVVKPQMMQVDMPPHSCRGKANDKVPPLGTLMPQLQHTLRPTSQPGMLRKLQPVHCLPAGSAGLQLVAKTRTALTALAAAMEGREIRKGYVALVSGKLQGRGRVEIPLDGQPSATAWQGVSWVCSYRHTWVSTIIVHPLTERKNQVRRHMALIGHPIIGDPQYGYAYASQVRDGAKRARERRAAAAAAAALGQRPPQNVAELMDRAEDEEEPPTQAAGQDSWEDSATVALHRMGRRGDDPAAEQHSASLAMDRLRFESKASTSGQPRSMAPRQHTTSTSRTVVPLVDPAHYHLQTAKPGHRFAELCPGKEPLHMASTVTGWPLCLWAGGLSLTHPITGALLSCEASEPAFFATVRKYERQAWLLHAEHDLQTDLRQGVPWAAAEEPAVHDWAEQGQVRSWAKPVAL